jgi:ELWxxDGT repeat protein
MDLAPGPKSGAPDLLTAKDSQCIFTARTEQGCESVWVSEGVAENTRCAASFPEGVHVECIFVHRDRAFFYTRGLDETVALWRIGQEPLQAEKVLQLPPALRIWEPGRMLPASCLPPASPTLSSEEAYIVQALYPCAPLDRAIQPVSIGKTTYFVANTAAYGAELWRTDGQVDSTTLVADLYPGRPSSSPAWLSVLGDTLYFVAERPTDGRVLWRTRGEFENTSALYPNMSNGMTWGTVAPREMAVCSRSIVLCSPRPVSNEEGFVEFGRFTPNEQGGEYEPVRGFGRDAKHWPHSIACAESRVFFVLDDGQHGEELWCWSEENGVYLVRDIALPADLSSRQSR